MSSQKILLVDDEPMVIEALRRSLQHAEPHWDIRCARSGPEALEVLERRPVDVAICDMRMPGMDGPELLRRIRDRWPDTLRVILSGYAEEDAVREVVGLAHQYLYKPCTVDVLLATIRRAPMLKALLQNASPEADSGPHPVDRPAPMDQLTACLQRPNPSLSEAADIVASDCTVATRVMRIMNDALADALPGEEADDTAFRTVLMPRPELETRIMPAPGKGEKK